MRSNWMMLALAATLGTGCAGTNGVYTFFVYPGAGQDPTVEVQHNYLGAFVPDDDDDEWTITETEDGSPQVFFGEIFDVAGEDSKVLVAQDQVLFGNKVDGNWVFEWAAFETDETVETHDTGYSFSHLEDLEMVTTLTVDLSGRTGTGTFETRIIDIDDYAETDTWDQGDVGRFNGATPAANYLVDDDGSSVRNEADETDCEADPCTLVVTRTVQISGDLEVRQTNAGRGDFDGIDQASNPLGVDRNPTAQ